MYVKMTPLQEDITCYIFAAIFGLLFIGYFIYDNTLNFTLVERLIDFINYLVLIFMIGFLIWLARADDYVEKERLYYQ